MSQRLTKRRHDRKRENYEVCLQITSRFGLAKVIVRVNRTRVLENISDILTVSSPFTLFHYVLNKIFYNGKAFIGVLELSGAPTTCLDLGNSFYL